jgi:hypothetical protein
MNWKDIIKIYRPAAQPEKWEDEILIELPEEAQEQAQNGDWDDECCEEARIHVLRSLNNTLQVTIDMGIYSRRRLRQMTLFIRSVENSRCDELRRFLESSQTAEAAVDVDRMERLVNDENEGEHNLDHFRREMREFARILRDWNLCEEHR